MTDDGGPALALYWSEIARATAGWALFAAALPLAPTLPDGDGHPVLVLPGLLAGDASTVALRSVLARLGYAVCGWDLGRNIGPTAKVVQGLDERLADCAQRHGRAVSLVGWSLGGIYARTLALRSPHLVRQVVTLGSPFRLTSPSQSRASRAFERFSHLHVKPTQLPFERGAAPVPVPATSIYSRYDGIVAWQACLDTPSPRAENVEVIGSHLGLGHNPSVIWVVADRLAQPEGAWRPFRPPSVLRPFYPQRAGSDLPPGAAAA
jgi:pimeloyl-ACP methyl ester carboxylesterase